MVGKGRMILGEWRMAVEGNQKVRNGKKMR